MHRPHTISPLPLVAHSSHPSTGITLQVRADAPGVQFYTGNFLDGSFDGEASQHGSSGRLGSSTCQDCNHSAPPHCSSFFPHPLVPKSHHPLQCGVHTWRVRYGTCLIHICTAQVFDITRTTVIPALGSRSAHWQGSRECGMASMQGSAWRRR